MSGQDQHKKGLKVQYATLVVYRQSVYNNPFMIWGRYRKRFFRYYLPMSFQFHHTQMDGTHAGRFLENLQKAVSSL